MSVLVAGAFEDASPALPSPSFAVDESGRDSTFCSSEATSIFCSAGDVTTGSIDGVVGTLFSATVSRVLVPVLGPRADALELEGGVGCGSGTCIAAAWSGFETGASLFRDVFDCVWSVSFFLTEEALCDVFEGGGDFNRGEVGHDGGFCAGFICLSEVRPPSRTASTLGGCRIGLCTDSARCTAAAEGTVDSEPVIVAFRVGLNSWLPLRDLESWGMPVTLRELRAGEVSRGI